MRIVYHPFLSTENDASGQALAIIFKESFDVGATGQNLGHMTDDYVTQRNLNSSGRFQHRFSLEVRNSKTGKAVM